MKFKWGVLRGKFQGGQGVYDDAIQFHADFEILCTQFWSRMNNFLAHGETEESPIYVMLVKTFENLFAAINSDYSRICDIVMAQNQVALIDKEIVRLQGQLSIKENALPTISPQNLPAEIRENLKSLSIFENQETSVQLSNDTVAWSKRGVVMYQEAVLDAEIDFITNQITLLEKEKMFRVIRYKRLRLALYDDDPVHNSDVAPRLDNVQDQMLSSSAPRTTYKVAPIKDSQSFGPVIRQSGPVVSPSGPVVNQSVPVVSKSVPLATLSGPDVSPAGLVVQPPGSGVSLSSPAVGLPGEETHQSSITFQSPVPRSTAFVTTSSVSAIATSIGEQYLGPGPFANHFYDKECLTKSPLDSPQVNNNSLTPWPDPNLVSESSMIY